MLQTDQIGEEEMDRHVVCMGENKNAYRISIGKPEGKKLVRRPTYTRDRF
jgi:hypothetical protein